MTDGPGRDRRIIMAGYAGIAGTKHLIEQEGPSLAERFPASWLEDAVRAADIFSSVNAEKIAHETACAFVVRSGAGGVLASLWELSTLTGAGIDIDLRAIPIRQETIEICELLDLDPYHLDSTGVLLAVCDRPWVLQAAMAEEDIPCSVIGKLTDNHDKLIRSAGRISCLNRPRSAGKGV